MKNKSLLSIEKKCYKMRKNDLNCNYKKLVLKNSDIKKSFDKEYKDVLKKQF